MVAISRTAETISLYQSRHSRSSVSILCRVGYNSSAQMLQHPRSGFGTASKEHSGEMMMKAPRFIELRPIFRGPRRTSSKACTQRATIPIFVRLSTLLYYDCLKPIEIDTATASYAVPEQPARRPLCTTKRLGRRSLSLAAIGFHHTCSRRPDQTVRSKLESTCRLRLHLWRPSPKI